MKMIARLSLATILSIAPGLAHAEPVVLDGQGISFLVIAFLVTGSLAWWRHAAGDRLAAVAVWSAAVLAGLMLTRYGTNDTWRFLANMVGA